MKFKVNGIINKQTNNNNSHLKDKKGVSVCTSSLSLSTSLASLLLLLLRRRAFLRHFLTKIHRHCGAARTVCPLLACSGTTPPALPPAAAAATGPGTGPGPGQALVVRGGGGEGGRGRRRTGSEVDAGRDLGGRRGSGGRRLLGVLHLPPHLLRQVGEVLPQLRHAHLQLVPLTQQLLLLAHLEEGRQEDTEREEIRSKKTIA